MNTLYELAKRIDALTANSQQVLNALIRSCIATGSSRGYSVRKYDRVIEMSRVDIYRLYDFYQSWEAAGFDPEKFDGLLAAADSRWNRAGAEVENAATVAVMKHSQMLYLTDTDKDREEPDYWTGKVRDSASGKATVATAPIPLNLRTPLYDENLSTKSFSQYETYLFPIGYQRLQILGTPNNGEDYLAGGKNWTIGVSDEFKVNADSIMLGAISNPDSRKVNRTYNEAFCTFSWGQNSYGLGPRTFAAGDHAIAVGDTSFSLGKNTVSLGECSMAEGEKTVSVAPRSVAMNSNTVAGGFDSIAANQDTVTGGYPYYFTMDVTVDAGPAILEKCELVNLTEDEKGCLMQSVSAVVSGSSMKVIKVVLTDIDRLIGDVALHDGDMVYVYMQYSDRSGNVNTKPYEDGGLAYKVLSTSIVSIAALSDGQDEYLVTLADPIPTGMDGSSVTGGYIKAWRSALVEYDLNGVKRADKRQQRLGQASNALNYNTLAYGNSQTAVGTSNLPDYNARFIVGTGSSYIYDSGAKRQNGLVVAPWYSYMQTADEYARLSICGNDASYYPTGMGPGIAMTTDGPYSREKITMSNNFGIKLSVYAKNTNIDGASILLDRVNDGELIMKSNGLMELTTVSGNIEITAGDVGYLKQKFAKLTLDGDTSGALTADCNARSFTIPLVVRGQKTYISAIKNSGFYYSDGTLQYTLGDDSGISWVDAQNQWPSKLHVLTMYNQETDTDYAGAALVFPAFRSKNPASDYVCHPKFVTYNHTTITGSIGTTASTSNIAEELAYLSDLDTVMPEASINLCELLDNGSYGYYDVSPTGDESNLNPSSYIITDAMPDIDGTNSKLYYPTDMDNSITRDAHIKRIGIVPLEQTPVYSNRINIRSTDGDTRLAGIMPPLESVSREISIRRYGKLIYLPLVYYVDSSQMGPAHIGYHEMIFKTNETIYSILGLPDNAPDFITLRGVGIGGITAALTITRRDDPITIHAARTYNGPSESIDYGGANYIIHLAFRIPNYGLMSSAANIEAPITLTAVI